MSKTKGFIMGATLLALVLITGLACGVKPAQTPTSLPPSELEIPANYTTYTDESNLFSISYPSDWETALSLIPGLEQNAKEVINNLKKGIAVEELSTIFFAGRRIKTVYEPNINILIESAPAWVSTHDEMIEAEVRGVEMIFPNYHEISRINTTINGREATIFEWEGALPQKDKFHYLQMFTLVDKTIWAVTCTAFPDDFAEWEQDFDTIVRSLRISD